MDNSIAEIIYFFIDDNPIVPEQRKIAVTTNENKTYFWVYDEVDFYLPCLNKFPQELTSVIGIDLSKPERRNLENFKKVGIDWNDVKYVECNYSEYFEDQYQQKPVNVHLNNGETRTIIYWDDDYRVEDVTEEWNEWCKEYESLNEKIIKEDDIYYRFTTKDAFGDNMGGLFSSVWKYIYSAEDYDDYEDDELEDLIDKLQDDHEVPSEWLGEKVNFAFSKEFVERHSQDFKRIEELLNEGDWSLVKTEVEKNKVNVIYEDENQIAYTLRESLNESQEEYYYRGYDSRYGVFDSPSEYSKLYTWVTDSIEYAQEYAENNKFGKVAKVRITCSDDEIGGVLDLPEDVDYYDPGDEEFQEYILDQDLKGYGFEAGDYDDFCLCISRDCVEVVDKDVC